VNAVAFEPLTGLPSAPCPISYDDYVKARLPFYHTIETGAIDGSEVLNEMKSVGELDAIKGLITQSRMLKGLVPIGCAICRKYLTDSMYV
jgi:hypothetical protein